MAIDWNEPGFPQKHFHELRTARTYAFRAIAVTAALFALLLLGTMFGRVPALATAFAATIFLLFGLLGGLASLRDTYRYVQVIPYFEHELGEIDTFLAGRVMVRVLKQLDEIATDQNAQPLSSFGFADDLCGEKLQWHDPKIGLHSIAAIKERLARLQVPEKIQQPLMDDLNKWQQALERAAVKNVMFCVLLRHGNSTSGQEWEVRKGSAF
jgi:hypothetical protein